MLRLRFLPAAERLIDIDSVSFGTGRRTSRQLSRYAADRNCVQHLLAFIAVQVVQVRRRDPGGSVFLRQFYPPLQQAARRVCFPKDTQFRTYRRRTLSARDELRSPMRAAHPRYPLRERCGGSARAGIQNRHILVETRDKCFGLRVVVIVVAQRVTPCCQIAPARAAGSFRIRRDHSNAVLHQIAPLFDVLRVAFAHQKDDGRRVGRTVVRQARLPVGWQNLRLVRNGIDIVKRGRVSQHQPAIRR